MNREDELEIVRRAYAKQIMAVFGVSDRRIGAAFAAVPRERFLGSGPWPILRGARGYAPSPSRDPVYLYANVVVGIVPERNLNNGEPALHALMLANAMPRPGEHAVHIGAGVGYYTAILARLVGRSGRVTAIEYDPELARRLGANLTEQRNIEIVHGDGSKVEFAPADVIYVNAGVTRPPDAWLDRLRDGGRLIVPLTTDEEHRSTEPVPLGRRGVAFRIERRGDEYHARGLIPVAFIPCESARDADNESALAGALADGGWQNVTRLYRHADVSEEACWLRGQGWCLAYR